MSTYSSLLKTPGVARIIAAQLTARFPFGMLSLAFLLHIERIHHSYGAAGLVLGAMSIGQAIAGPMTSRLMGVLGMRVVLWTTLALCAAAVAGRLFFGSLSPFPFAVLLGVGIVAMLYLVTEELLVEAHEVEETHWSVAAFFLGFLLFLVIEMPVEN